MGRAYRPFTTFGVDLTASRNDNASYYRELAWNAGCACVTYTSPERPIP